MATPITWSTVAAPDLTGELAAISKANQGISDAFTNTVTEFTDLRKKQDSDALIAKLRSAGSEEERKGLIDEANSASSLFGLDNEKILAAQNAATGRDILLATEARAQASGERDVLNDAQTIKESNARIANNASADLRAVNKEQREVKIDERTGFEQKRDDTEYLANKPLKDAVLQNQLTSTENTANESVGKTAVSNAVKAISELDAGDDRASAIKVARAELLALPGVTVSQVSTAFQKYVDLDFELRAINPAEFGLAPDKIANGTQTATDFSNYEAELNSALRLAKPNVSDTAINRKVSKITRNIPGYAAAKIKAGVQQESINLVNKENVVFEAEVQADKNTLKKNTRNNGQVGAISDLLRVKNKEAFSELTSKQLNDSVRETLKRVNTLYAGKVKSKTDKDDLAHAVYKMYRGSNSGGAWWWKGVVGVPGTDGGFWRTDTDLSKIDDNLLLQAMSPHLPSSFK